MRNVRVATIQMQCAKDVATNIQTAERLVRQAAEQGAQIILLPELFEHPYFCQERQYDYYQYAQSVAENTAIQHFKVIAKELQVVLPISFYEKMVMSCITLLPSLMQMGKCWAFIERPTYQMTIIIKKNSISRLVTLVSRSGILAMLRLVSVSVGINGSLKQRAVLH